MEQIKAISVPANKQGAWKNGEKRTILIYNTVVKAIGILIARAIPFMGVAPFGVSFLATERRFSISAVISALMAAIGYLSLFNINFAVRYIASILIYLIFLFTVANRDEDVTPMLAICAAGVSVGISHIGEMIWVGYSPGGVIQLICDASLTVAGAVVFERTRGALRGDGKKLFSMNKEERLYGLFLAAILFVGVKSFYINQFFSAANVAGLWLVAIFAICGGVTSATVCAVVVGMLSGTRENILLTVSLFALCGIACGVIARYGRTCVCITISIISAILAIYCSEKGVLILGYMDIPLSILAIILTPDAIIRNIGRIFGVKRRMLADAGYRDFTKMRLNSAAESFVTLAQTFLDISDEPEKINMEDISIMFDGVADRVCKKCSRMSECWVTDFDATYQSMLKMLNSMEEKGEMTESCAEGFFEKRCLRIRSFVREINRLYEIYKINCVWKSKLCENRRLAGQQLGSMAQILDTIAEEICDEKLDNGIEEEIIARLEEKNIIAAGADVTVNMIGRYSAFLEVIAPVDAEVCQRSVEKVLKSVLGMQMVMVGATGTPGGVLMRFTQPEGYIIESAVASAGKSARSGDNCALRYLSNGKFAAALSDGMGTGARASRDSGATVKLLGDFLEAGFDKSLAVRLINSIMVMKSVGEAFSTVDMCVIDLFSGETEFVKNGAEPSYIRRGKEVETIRAASLPVGVMQEVEIETFAHNVTDGDIIVILSDGIQAKKGCEDWIKTIISEAEDNMPPQELADRLVEMAKALGGGEPQDDMTAIVLKVYAR